MEPEFCQSCGMPLTEDVLGTNADGSKNEDYCIFCFKDGAFTGNFTMEEMIDFCSQFVEKYNQDAGQNLTRDEYKELLHQYYPNLKRWKMTDSELPHADSPLKAAFIEEVNALNIADMPKINNLYVLQGSFINIEYDINGHKIKLLDDNESYWGTQVEKGGGRCYGIACDEKFIIVSEYGQDGVDPELVMVKKR